MFRTQLALFGHEAPSFDASFGSLRRIELGRGAWLDYGQHFVGGHEALFEHLATMTSWRESEERIYDKRVRAPRLYAVLPDDGPGHPLFSAIQAALAQRYGEEFTRVSLGFYRHGRDSVAWHGDRVARRMDQALVATVSVGAARRFLLRPYGGGRSLGLNLGCGDLLIMGGTCQRTFQHCVPKVAHAEPRIAIMFRPHWELPERSEPGHPER